MRIILSILLLASLFQACSEDKQDTEISESVDLSFEDLVLESPDTLRLMRNEIFARKGYIFKSQDLNDHFNNKEWYEPKYSNVDSLLSSDETERIKLIVDAERFIKENSKTIAYFEQSAPYSVGKISLPTNLNDFINEFEEPDSTFIDPDQFCPIGQLNFWNFEILNFQLIVLGDKYGEPVDFSAKSRVTIFRIIDNEKMTHFPRINNISLGEQEEEVTKKLNEFLDQFDSFKLETFTGETLIDRFLIEDLKMVYWLTDDSIFYHFVIGESGSLEYIIFANFNIRIAC